MKNKWKKGIQIKIIIFFSFLIILYILISNILARYESNAIGTGEMEVAFYLLNENYQSMSISLSDMVPREGPYIYNFSVANYNATDRTEVELEYDLTIVMTTNLPLGCELYFNETYLDINAENIAASSSPQPDADGTYFKTILTPKVIFGHTTNQINNYQLIIYFPEIYKSIEYQNIIEVLEIQVNSRQRI